MRRLLPLAVLVLLGTPLAAAPATTQPARKLLVHPFTVLGPHADVHAWLAPAVQENLVVAASRARGVEASPATRPAGSLEAARKAAREAGATLVVFGSAQILDTDVRLTAQLYDVSADEPVRHLTATGTLRDLFQLEDVLANQLRRGLTPPPPPPATEVVAMDAPLPPPSLDVAGPLRINRLNRPGPVVPPQHYNYYYGRPTFFYGLSDCVPPRASYFCPPAVRVNVNVGSSHRH